MAEFLDPISRPIKDGDGADHWRPIGRIVQKIARELTIPPATVIAMLEANRIRIEAAE